MSWNPNKGSIRRGKMGEATMDIFKLSRVSLILASRSLMCSSRRSLSLKMVREPSMCLSKQYVRAKLIHDAWQWWARSRSHRRWSRHISFFSGVYTRIPSQRRTTRLWQAFGNGAFIKWLSGGLRGFIRTIKSKVLKNDGKKSTIW